MFPSHTGAALMQEYSHNHVKSTLAISEAHMGKGWQALWGFLPYDSTLSRWVQYFCISRVAWEGATGEHQSWNHIQPNFPTLEWIFKRLLMWFNDRHNSFISPLLPAYIIKYYYSGSLRSSHYFNLLNASMSQWDGVLWLSFASSLCRLGDRAWWLRRWPPQG